MTPALPAIKPWLILALAIGTFAAGWVVHGWKDRSDRLAAVVAAFDVRTARELAANERSEAAEARRAALEKENRNLNRSLARETRNDAYRCPLPAGGAGLLNAARTGAAPDAPGQPDGTLPGTGAGVAR